ncbi:MAG: ribose-phosphate pyrophosphokinase [Candidatus Izemoplasmatales bacterium]|jgi:ribose-phosphate pyrophosphokinase|nr:ribose-phosphate pyrophosphokinase [Candidatus Izemoplasmatales bacterium]MDD3865458.1 ribose-phosphate pyrophosphokinase [Candidatus Izemoplasmatales bacterium]
MAIFHGSKVKIFALSSNIRLAQEIADYIGIPLSDCEVFRFADGEINIDIRETVRGHKVFVIQSTCCPVNENIMELLIMMDALKRASAREINIVMPYYGYSRQDRKAKARQPISAKLIADLVQTAGATRVICMDLHAAQIQGFFNIPIDNFRALPIVAEYFKQKNIKNICVVSPDHGGVARARSLANVLGAPIAIIDKTRPEPNIAEVMNIIGQVKGMNCIIIDDMIDTGGSIAAASVALKAAGAKDIYAACTHPLLSGQAPERIMNSPIVEMICTNTVFLPEEKKFSKLVQLSIAKLLGQGIINIIDDQGVSSLFG